MDLKSRIRTIPDYPEPGIQFRDITTLLLDPDGLRTAVEELARPFASDSVDLVAGIEARGFILGGAVATTMGVGFVPIRKHGKLPAAVNHREYELEYGTDVVEIHRDAVRSGDRVLVVDDLVATGGTALAGVHLLEQSGATLVGATFVIDLPDLGGADRLREYGIAVHALVSFFGS